MISMLNCKNPKYSLKEQNPLINLQIQEKMKQKQLKDIYEKLSKIIDKGASLENHKNEIINNEAGLTKLSNQQGIDLGKELLVRKKKLKEKEDYYAGLKANIIANSTKIKESSKELLYIKQEVQRNEELYCQLKKQTEKIKALQSSIVEEIDSVNKQIRLQTQKKLKLVQQPIDTSDNTDLLAKKAIILLKIEEMKKMNQTLTQLVQL